MMQPFNLEEHKRKLDAIRERLEKGEITQSQLNDEIDKALGVYCGFFAKLKEFIRGKVGGKISFERRETLGVNAYVQLIVQKQDELITSFNWLVELRTWIINFPNEEGAKAVHEMNDSDLIDYNQILIQASKQLIDNNQENSEFGQKIHAYYLLLKPELEKRIPDYASLRGQDGFLEYLSSREERQRKTKLLSETRVTGSLCPYCESTHTVKDGNSFRCKECGKRWRKAGYSPKDESLWVRIGKNYRSGIG